MNFPTISITVINTPPTISKGIARLFSRIAVSHHKLKKSINKVTGTRTSCPIKSHRVIKRMRKRTQIVARTTLRKTNTAFSLLAIVVNGVTSFRLIQSTWRVARALHEDRSGVNVQSIIPSRQLTLWYFAQATHRLAYSSERAVEIRRPTVKGSEPRRDYLARVKRAKGRERRRGSSARLKPCPDEEQMYKAFRLRAEPDAPSLVLIVALESLL